MQIFESYTLAMWGIFVILITLLLQSLVAGLSKAKQPGAVPGKIDTSISHASFVFRSNRTMMNSLENISPMLGASLLAILAGANVFWTGLFIWVFAVGRIIHMALYYFIATEKNPSPRSYFYLIGVIANICLLGLIAKTLL